MEKDKVYNDEVFELSDISFLGIENIRRVVFAGKRFGLYIVYSGINKRGDYKKAIKRFEKHFEMKFNLSTLATLEECEEASVRSKRANEILTL